MYICTIITYHTIEAVKGMEITLNLHSLFPLMDFNFLDWSTITFMALSVSRDLPHGHVAQRLACETKHHLHPKVLNVIPRYVVGTGKALPTISFPQS